MDALEEAKDGMKLWSETSDPEMEAKWSAYAQAWAAIAQAEQLKRIADALYSKDNGFGLADLVNFIDDTLREQ